MAKRDYLEAREDYIKLIKKELLGPGSEVCIPDEEHELISTSPQNRYSIGVLFPQEKKINADNDEVEADEPVDENADDQEAVIDGIEEDNSNQDDSHERSYEDESLDEEVALAAQNKPSSMGISFLATGNAESVTCRISFATYHRAAINECMVPVYVSDPSRLHFPFMLADKVYYDEASGCLKLHNGIIKAKEISKAYEYYEAPEDDLMDLKGVLYRLADQAAKGYVRDPHAATVTLDFTGTDFAESEDLIIDNTTAKLTALRRKYTDDLWSITVMLINDSIEKIRENGDKTESMPTQNPCFFQPKIEILTEDNNFLFYPYGGNADFNAMDPEEKSFALQYRNKLNYGAGLGVASDWDIQAGKGTLYTNYFPMSEVPGMDFRPPENRGIDEGALSMKYLSDLTDEPRENKLAKLKTVVDAYGKWIAEKNSEIPGLPEKYREPAISNMSGCTAAYERMQHGLITLSTDKNAWSAFELANRAMYMQRAHLSLQNQMGNIDRYPDDDEMVEMLERIEDEGYCKVDSFLKDYYSWRLFQIAFLVMSVDSIASDELPDRKIVDLIWFPTGGGKTEAYLGLTAFSIFYRRLAYPESAGGTSVMMRYTLRLLTAQQFTRASAMICACEYIRSDSVQKKPKYRKYPLGDERITIGLWIGNEHTPGNRADAKEHINKLYHATTSNLRTEKDSHNKFQTLKCPWCGTKMVKDYDEEKRALKGAWGYRASGKRIEMFCPQEACFFSSQGSLPIQVVDEELYDNPPSLLFATVDKFAMMPWNEQIGKFFGIDTPNRAPELIIQDELHLISGPLGTMVGLYETVVDELCKAKGGCTKIIGSTATIRHAREQCVALYGREVAQYPHPALDVEDSFFAREAKIDYAGEKFGRKYVGLMGSGRTKATMEVRTLAALLQRMQMMDLTDEVKDSYWTITSYFNSLKDLGKCQTLLEDDVKDSVRAIARRYGTGVKPRFYGSADELDSRVTTIELNETLNKLETLRYSAENIENKRYATSVLLATNMISVGIDVARLNVMLMVGQPKLTSEYIQATSRVGRSDPGVVFTLYDAARSRDRSHYEQFCSYHESFYKSVEPTGATPFSKPARERALHAVIIALLRNLVPQLSGERSAGHFSKPAYAAVIDRIKKVLTERAALINSYIDPDLEDESKYISDEIDEVLDRWEELAQNAGEDNLNYGRQFMVKAPEGNQHRLMKIYNSGATSDEHPFDTMSSMRSVDGSVLTNIRIWED